MLLLCFQGDNVGCGFELLIDIIGSTVYFLMLDLLIL